MVNTITMKFIFSHLLYVFNFKYCNGLCFKMGHQLVKFWKVFLEWNRFNILKD